MLPKRERLDTKRFDEIIASGRNISAGAFYLKALNSDLLRFSVVIPKKVAKSAIKRHLLKRRVFNSIKENKAIFPVGDYIVFANKEMVDMNTLQINENIKNMAQKLASR
jgi:ribonuclease P protein component